jgi:hypothetical protein
MSFVRAATAALFVALILVAAAQARSAATVTVTPSPAHVGDELVFAGCGYGPSKDIQLEVYAPGDVDTNQGLITRTGTDGCFDSTGVFSYTPPAPGTYAAYVFPKTGSGVGVYGHHKPLVDYDFDVSP